MNLFHTVKIGKISTIINPLVFAYKYIAKTIIRKLKDFVISLFEKDNLFYAQNHWIEIVGKTSESPIAQHKIHELETTLFVRNYLKKGDCVFDIGSNIGYFTLEFARLVGESGRIYSFEPHPEIFEVLKRNVKRNRYKNITLINAACGEHNGSQNLYFSTENEGNHKIIESKNSNGSVEVQIRTLTEFVKENRPRLIKMDIEGAELLALKGISEELIFNNNIDFIIEYHPYEMSFFGINGSEVINFFTKRGYKFRDLASHDFPSISPEELLEKYKKESFGITNLFCSKSID